ncbi:MAG: hypothetical protein KDA78_15410, partial [Planctomycetaceae bacterium]|nr:hypothetical protein [Planctomycetaceae bacterium]
EAQRNDGRGVSVSDRNNDPPRPSASLLSVPQSLLDFVERIAAHFMEPFPPRSMPHIQIYDFPLQRYSMFCLPATLPDWQFLV